MGLDDSFLGQELGRGSRNKGMGVEPGVLKDLTSEAPCASSLPPVVLGVN